MNNLIVKDVAFNDANLIAVQNKETGKVYAGVNFVCNGIGLSKSQKDWQIQTIQKDLVLKQG